MSSSRATRRCAAIAFVPVAAALVVVNGTQCRV